MASSIVLLGIITGLCLFGALQLYINSTLIRRLRTISSRIEQLETYLGLDPTNENSLTWIANGEIESPLEATPGTHSPKLELTTLYGTKIMLGSLSTAPTLLLFLSNRCSTCTYLLGAVLDYLETAPQPFKFPSAIIVLSEEIIEPEVEEIGKEGIKVMQVIDNGKVSKFYGVDRTPCAIILDKEGIICNAGYISNLEELFTTAERAREFMQKQARELDNIF